MEFCYKFDTECGRSYQLHFVTEGMSLSISKKYSALIINNQFIGYCEGDAQKSLFRPTFELPDEHHYKILTNINCWDLLLVMETEYIDDDILIYICFGPKENEFIVS